MKTIFTCCLLFLSFSIFSQIFNGDFEDWKLDAANGTPIEIPEKWTCNNEHTPWGGPNTPVLKVQGISGFACKIESNYKGVDAQSSGYIYQEIDLNNVKKISFEARCDSIFKKGFCQIVLFGMPEMEILYTDTLWEKNTDFQFYEFEVDETWKDGYDFAQLKFIANGEIFELDPQNEGYAAFTVDNVFFEKIAATKILISESEFGIFPNPASSTLSLSIPAHFTPIFIEFRNLNGQLEKKCTFQNQLNISNLDTGIYFVSTICKEGILTKKVILEQ
jgi:hypothetical protein